ncbi:MAG: hypothetical protein QN174_07830 [Armatimonadota bacterium]|nr:hypothetical protein [Armatimonadota bacterium]
MIWTQGRRWLLRWALRDLAGRAPHISAIEATHHWPDGSVKWRAEIENRLFYEGIDLLLEFAYRGVDNFPAAWYGRLFGGAPADDDTITDLTGEPGGNGYAALTWTRNTTDWGAVTLVGSEKQTRGVKKTFGPATADWPTVTTFVLATASDGTAKLWARFTLPEPITVLAGEDLDVRPIGVVRGVTS